MGTDTQKKRCYFEDPVPFEVPFRAARGDQGAAKTAASLCFKRFRDGSSKQDVSRYLEAMLESYTGGEDVSEGSDAWKACKIDDRRCDALVEFDLTSKSGGAFHFQTTKK